MNRTAVPFSEPASGAAGAVLDRLLGKIGEMSPQVRKAAQFVLDNPNEVGVSSIREIAGAAGVKPNSLVRMARAVGFSGFEDFREPFRAVMRAGGESFPDRARWLQALARGGRLGKLYSGMAAASIDNLERVFAATDADAVKAAADAIVAARTTYVLGVGAAYSLAHNFAYLANMALGTATALPRDGSLPVDDMARAGPEDVLIAMTFAPYRREVVQSVHHARAQGMTVIALSDSRSSPIARAADHVFVVPIETPQFFMSTVAAAAILETLMAFVVADAPAGVIADIERFHDQRTALGAYWEEG